MYYCHFVDFDLIIVFSVFKSVLVFQIGKKTFYILTTHLSYTPEMALVTKYFLEIDYFEKFSG